MSETIVKTVVRKQKTTAGLFAVVFLLLTAGCVSDHAEHEKSTAAIDLPNEQQVPLRRKKRRRASEYSRLPMNTPAAWQTSTIGN